MAFSHLLLLLPFFLGADGTVFTLKNNCEGTIWPGILTSYEAPSLLNGGFELKAGESKNITAPNNWSGKLWAREGCYFDDQGIGYCAIGDCGGTLHCEGNEGAPPVSVAEFVLGSDSDTYDISLVNGYNMEVSVEPVGGDGNCTKISCNVDLSKCSPEMQIRVEGKAVACLSPCLVFRNPMACCTGEFSDPQKCESTSYTDVFKSDCPLAYNFAFDDATKSYTCTGADYVLSFC